MRPTLIIGIVLSLLIHGGVFFLPQLFKKGPPPPPPKEATPTVELMQMPDLPEDKPETPPDQTEQSTPVEMAPPSLVDVPTVAPLDAFTQQVEPPPPPKMGQSAPVVSIPPAGAGRTGASSNVFHL